MLEHEAGGVSLNTFEAVTLLLPFGEYLKVVVMFSKVNAMSVAY